MVLFSCPGVGLWGNATQLVYTVNGQSSDSSVTNQVDNGGFLHIELPAGYGGQKANLTIVPHRCQHPQSDDLAIYKDCKRGIDLLTHAQPVLDSWKNLVQRGDHLPTVLPGAPTCSCPPVRSRIREGTRTTAIAFR